MSIFQDLEKIVKKLSCPKRLHPLSYYHANILVLHPEQWKLIKELKMESKVGLDENPCKVIVTLKDNNTKEVKEIKQDFLFSSQDIAGFVWTEGNFGCDCNRHLLFYPDEEECECGETRFSLL